jgi:hypothetical protein
LMLAGEREISLIDFWLLVPFAGSPLFEEYGQSLLFDERVSDFAAHPETCIDIDFVKKYPKTFSALHYYATKYIDRNTFLRIVYLMLNLSHLRYTSFMLARDSRLGFPGKFLEELSLLKLPTGNIYQNSATLSALSGVCDFIRDIVNPLNLECHPVHDIIKFDLAWNDVSFSDIRDKRIRVEQFSYDILEYIRNIKSCRYEKLPTAISSRPCSILFRKSSDNSVDAVKIPDLFRGSATVA